MVERVAMVRIVTRVLRRWKRVCEVVEVVTRV